MTTYQEHIQHSRRLCLLRLISEANGTLNESVIKSGLVAYGFSQSHKDMRADIRFLINHGCLTDEWIGDIMVLTITARGMDVSKGFIQINGIQKPSLGA